jgi:hypothetical protein
VSALLGYLDRGLEARDMRRGHVAQCILTPTAADVVLRFGGICSSLERQMARQCNKAIMPWLKKQRPGSKHALNVAIADFVGRDSPFASTVIQLNSKLLEQPSLSSPSIKV